MKPTKSKKCFMLEKICQHAYIQNIFFPDNLILLFIDVILREKLQNR